MLVAALLVGGCDPQAERLFADQLVTARGSATGDLERLTTVEESAAGAMRFVPASDGYSGHFIFHAPAGASPTEIEVLAGFKGPSVAQNRWQLKLFDFQVRTWVTIGDNGEAQAGTWSLLSPLAPAPVERFIDSNGEIWVRLSSDPSTSPSADAASLDLLAVDLIDPPDPAPGPGGDSSIQNYVVLGNGWSATQAPQHEIDYAVDAFALAQEHREASARTLVANGAKGVLKYRLGIGALPDSTAPEDIEVWNKVRGAAPGYTKDIRMRAAGGGYMIHDFGFYLVDVVTPENRAIFRRILKESLQPFLTGTNAFQGAFLDVAGPHNPAYFSGKTPAPPGGYSREAELAGWIEVNGGLRADFPGKEIVINAHHPWEIRTPVDFTGLGLALSSGVGMMSESRMMTWGTISGWTDETILDVGAFLTTGQPVVVTYSFPSSTSSRVQQRYWSLATYLLAVGDARNGYYGMDGIVSDDRLADFPEMRFEGLGAALGDIHVLANGRIFERVFEQGRVVAHVKVGFPNETYTVPAGMEVLTLEGGGAYPATGRLTWQPIAPGPRTLVAPASPMPSGTSLILRETPAS